MKTTEKIHDRRASLDPIADAPGADYDDYGPAHRNGVSAYSRDSKRSFDDVEADVSSGWKKVRRKSSLDWSRVKDATPNAWNRLGAFH